jgi:sec-independent protein translocase protein TatB
VFDLSISKILILGLLALIIFGPDQLPKVAAQAGRALRDLRRIAESAKADLQEGLGPEFRDFDINDLNPRTFVRKHLWEEFDATETGSATAGTTTAQQDTVTPATSVPHTNGAVLPMGETPPFDVEAT